MKSNFSPAAPVQGPIAIGMRFWRKSPAVGSIERQLPEEVTREAEVKARVAVVSLGLDSAAAEGWRTPPARETGTGVVGLEDASWGVGDGDEADRADDTGVAATVAVTAVDEALAAEVGVRITVLAT